MNFVKEGTNTRKYSLTLTPDEELVLTEQAMLNDMNIEAYIKAMLVNATQQSTRTTAYVDGTYSEKLERYGYGVVIRQNGKCWKYSGSASDKDMVSMNSVAGEICAATIAIKWALSHRIPSIDIYYDYSGIEHWVTGVWKANEVGTKRYRDFAKNATNILDIKFHKVKAHTGIPDNEEADRLAALAIRDFIDKGVSYHEYAY